MAAEPVFEAYTDVRRHRWAAWVVLGFGAVFTAFWLFLGAYDPTVLLDIGLILIGPVLLLGGVWGVRRRYRAQLRLRLVGDVLTVWPTWKRDVSQVFAVADLTRISLNSFGRTHWIQFDTKDRSVRIATEGLTEQRAEIVRRIALVIETQGNRLEEEMSPVLGAATGRFEVIAGPAY